eukprot:3703487-Rhodomonas_salina.2
MYATPCCAIKGARGTATTPAAPAIRPERPPIIAEIRPRMTDDQIPSRGLTPAMFANAVDAGIEVSATTRPERISLVFEYDTALVGEVSPPFETPPASEVMRRFL